MTTRSVARPISSLAAGLAIVAVAAMVPSVAMANIYPSGLSVDTSAAAGTCGTVVLTYFLNEDADGTASLPGVKIEVVDGASTVVRTVSIPSQKKGKWTYAWDGRNDSGARVPNGSYAFRVTAADFGYSAWTQITDDNNRQLQFYRPIGVAVNRNVDPVTRVASPYYGRLYVANPNTLTTVSGRPMGDGIYVMSPDQSDALGQGDNALTGGLNFTGSTSSSPFRLRVGPDHNLYISDWSDPTGQLSLTDPDVSASSGVQVLQGVGDTANPTVHGSIASTAAIVGTLATGDLKVYALDEDMVPYQSLRFWNVGAGPLPYNSPPTQLGSPLINTVAGVAVDMDRGPDGKFYLLQNRSDGNQAGLYVLDTDGTTVLFNSLTATRALTGNPASVDLLRQSRTVAVSPDGSTCYILSDQGNIRILPMSGGIPNLAQLTTVTCFATGTANGQIVVDAVGNVFISSNVTERVRAYSPPSGPNSSTTATPQFTLSKSGSGGPAITAHPQNASFCVNGSVVFNVTATGTGLTYQWKKNGVDLVDGANVSGATTPSLTLSNVPASDNGSYVTVVVCDGNGVAVSNPAVLNIGVRILQAPLNASVCQNASAAFSVLASGKGTLSYRWEKDNAGDNNFVPIPGGTLSSVTLPSVSMADDNSQVRCVVTDDCGPVNSPAAVLRVSDGPTVTGLSGSKTVAVGSAATYSLVASGTGTVNYQWRKELNGVSTNVGTNTPFLSIVAESCDNGASIKCDVTDDCGTRSVTVGSLFVSNVPAETCGNGTDDDCDGLVDCEDPDCLSSCCNDPFADAEGVAGVGTGFGDGDVDMDDFAVFQICFSSAGLPTEPIYCSCFDRNGDNRVDVQDFGDFLNCASGPAIQADANCDNYSTGDVVINEFQYDDYNDAEDDREFVELYNRGASPVDISGWVLRAPSMSGKDVAIPGAPDSGTTVLAAGGFYVIGGVSVTNVMQVPGTGLDLWENGLAADGTTLASEVIELVDANGDVKDAVIYERGRGVPQGASAPEGAIWGDFGSVDGLDQMSWSRWVDGADTNDNGRDFGMRRETPGASNLGTGAVIAAYVPPDVNGVGAGTAVSGLVGSFVGGLVISPADTSTMLGADDVNPNVIPVSPQGGNCIVAWDPSGGGNMVASNDIMTGNASYDLWVYFDTSDITVAGAESTAYGIMGTTDYVFNWADPGGTLLPTTNVSLNGSTGLAWVYNKDNAGQVKRLFLVDAKGGGDSSPNGGSMDWTVHQTIDMSTVASGWYRLSISYTNDGSVTAIFNTQTFNFTTTAGLKGGFYVGYRESLSGTPASLRPPTFDRR